MGGFHGTDGFSVYDADGALAFRFDNYSRRSKLFSPASWCSWTAKARPFWRSARRLRR
jgi:hypothetical protein